MSTDLDHLRELDKAAPATEALREPFYLIERNDRAPYEWYSHEWPDKHGWTTDVNEAGAFQTAQQAESYIKRHPDVFGGWARATEHLWMEPPTLETEARQPLLDELDALRAVAEAARTIVQHYFGSPYHLHDDDVLAVKKALRRLDQQGGEK